jgi:hypothetical protein
MNDLLDDRGLERLTAFGLARFFLPSHPAALLKWGTVWR